MSYFPEHYYGLLPGTFNQYGLIPWPDHLRPLAIADVALTKKGERYVQAALAEADGVFFLTLAKGDRASIATTIERLINLLDAMEPDPDLEPSLASPCLGSGDDRELDDSDSEDGGDTELNGDETDFDGGENDADGFIWGGGEGVGSRGVPA